MTRAVIIRSKIPKTALMKKNGFTLIELLITVSIMGILFGLGIARYNAFNRRQILVQAARELKSDLRLAQGKALAGEKDCQVCGGLDKSCETQEGDLLLDGWCLSFSAGGYQLYGRCGDQQFSAKTINLSGRGVSLSFPLSEACFKPLAQGLGQAVTITLSGFGQTQQVKVTQAGEIE